MLIFKCIEWSGRFVVFPDHPHELSNVTHVDHLHPTTLKRLKEFSGDRFGRDPIFYNGTLQEAHLIHIPGDSHHRVLQHHYGQSIADASCLVLSQINYYYHIPFFCSLSILRGP